MFLYFLKFVFALFSFVPGIELRAPACGQVPVLLGYTTAYVGSQSPWDASGQLTSPNLHYSRALGCNINPLSPKLSSYCCTGHCPVTAPVKVTVTFASPSPTSTRLLLFCPVSFEFPSLLGRERWQCSGLVLQLLYVTPTAPTPCCLFSVHTPGPVV